MSNRTVTPNENAAIELAEREAADHSLRIIRQEQGKQQAALHWRDVEDQVNTQCSKITKHVGFTWKWHQFPPGEALRVDTGRGLSIGVARVEGDVEVHSFEAA